MRNQYQLLQNYGINLDQFLTLIENQQYKCKICYDNITESTGCVDHDHKTGVVRGILCTRCNTGLGMFRDNKTYLEHAITYLNAYEQNSYEIRKQRLKEQRRRYNKTGKYKLT